MDGWNLPEFGWPWQQWWPQVQDWATQREPYMPMPWYEQIPYWGAQAGLEVLNRTNPYLDPFRERWYGNPWNQPW